MRDDYGPNMRCTTTPITPLTSSSSTINSAINRMGASGTTNILSRALSRVLGGGDLLSQQDFSAFMQTELFDRIGISSAIPKFDGQGVWVGSSYCFMTARDFAKFGLLYLRGGWWRD